MMALSTTCARFWGVGTHIIQGGPGGLEPADLGPPCPVDGDAHSPGPAPGAFSPQDWVSAHSPAGGQSAASRSPCTHCWGVFQSRSRDAASAQAPSGSHTASGRRACLHPALSLYPPKWPSCLNSISGFYSQVCQRYSGSIQCAQLSLSSIHHRADGVLSLAWLARGCPPAIVCVVQDPDPRPWLGHSGHESCARRKGRMITAVCPRGCHSGMVV